MTVKLSGPMLPPASGTAKSIVVLLHGYGSDGRDLIALGQYWRESFPDTLFVAPNAHEACMGNPSGYQWFALDLDREAGRIMGAQLARPVIGDFLQQLWSQTGLGPQQTILAGFSQGAMMALDVGLRLEAPLAGIVAFSGMLIAPEAAIAEAGSKPPVLLLHGEADEVVSVEGSIAARAVLAQAGFSVTLHTSPGAGHTITQDGLDRATAFLTEKLDAKEG